MIVRRKTTTFSLPSLPGDSKRGVAPRAATAHNLKHIVASIASTSHAAINSIQTEPARLQLARKPTGSKPPRPDLRYLRLQAYKHTGSDASSVLHANDATWHARTLRAADSESIPTSPI